MNELFHIPEHKSPRLKWLERHNVSTQKTDHTTGDEDEFGEELFPWYAFIGVDMMRMDSRDITGGATEQEAIARLAIKNGWLLWNEEGLA